MRPFIVAEKAEFSHDAVTPEDLNRLDRQTRTPGFAFRTINDFARAYRAGEIDPATVAARALKAIRASNELKLPLRAVIKMDEEDLMRQARASTERFKSGKPLGIFDGVPVVVKDELDQVPFATGVGTRFLGKAPATSDSTPVARLRQAGALLIGKANMHEIGIGVTGLNPHHGAVRNPYDPARFTGGSSSGSGAATAAGLCPVAVGADGGGSIRIPSALCGVVGLKPTYGRVSEHGAAPLCWSVAHVGPMAATARDTALCYGLIAGEDPLDPGTLGQPPVRLTDLDNGDLKGIRLGIYEPWFRDAAPGVVKACENMLAALKERGAVMQDVEIPDLNTLRVAHVISIATEMAQSMDVHYQEHRRDFGLDVRVNLALARNLTNLDYVKAQRVRTRAILDFRAALEKADVIVMPATGCTAPLIRPSALPDGESDLTMLTEIMRFAPAANLTGLPGISFPAGYDEQGLPVGFQVMGRWWDEHLLLRLALVGEQAVERKKPQIYFDLLE